MSLQDLETYDPNGVFDAVMKAMHLKNDAALSRTLDVAPPVISKVRHKKLVIGASLLLRMHEASNISIAELRSIMGDRRGKFRVNDLKSK